MKCTIRSFIVALIWGTMAWGANAAPNIQPETNSPLVWKPRVNSVAVFKNGMGFFVREGETQLRDGWCVAGEIPPAYFGTLAFFAQNKNEIVDLVGSGTGEIIEFNGVDAPADSAAKRARLEPLRMLKLTIHYTHQDAKRTATGKLITIGADYVVLENEATNSAVPVDEIQKIQILEQPLRIHVAGAQAKTKLSVAYLRNGITWIPEYTMKIIDQDTAELTLRGTLVNEAEDLVHCDVNFVVGVPHFLHTDYMAPIACGQAIRTIGATLAPKAITTQISNSGFLFSNSLQSNGADGAYEKTANKENETRAVFSNLPTIESAGSSDFTVYTKKDLTVRQGEKAIVTLFTKRIKYSHIYRWSIPNSLEHFLVLDNQTDTAWTTGPCLALNDGSPLSEDLLRYTAKGATAEIPVTTAVNITHQQSETEESRELKKYEPSRGFWLDRVVIKGTVTIKNREKSLASVAVTLPVPGNPAEASDDGQITVDTSKLQLMERSGKIVWNLKVGTGESKVVTYKYERYVPSK